MKQPILSIVFVAAVALGLSCVEIEGGAVEASWVVRTEDGRAVSDCACADPAIAFVRFEIVGQGASLGTTPCTLNGAPRKECQFSCQRQTGTTPFDIPPGRYAISLVPTDASGQDLTMPDATRGSIGVPAPIVRDVIQGQPTQLETFLLVAGCSSSCSGMNNSKGCLSP